VTEPSRLAPHAHYLEGLERGELRYQRCERCERTVFYPRVACNHCGSADLRFATSAGLATVYSNTVVAQRDAPSYSVCLVDVDEGFRMMSSVVGIPAEEVQLGTRVEATFESIDRERYGQAARVVFRPVQP
jgi:uncharacterized OB-fold protein